MSHPTSNHDTSTYISYTTIYDYTCFQIDGLYLQISNKIMHSRLHIRDFPIFHKGMVPCKEC
jgi:hypothetical protein